MLSSSDVREWAHSIGIPATVVILVVLMLALGWVPFDTLASEHARQMQLQNASINKYLREICFNTAKDEAGEQRCKAL